jgi:hypothetical protein
MGSARTATSASASAWLAPSSLQHRPLGVGEDRNIASNIGTIPVSRTQHRPPRAREDRNAIEEVDRRQAAGGPTPALGIGEDRNAYPKDLVCSDIPDQHRPIGIGEDRNTGLCAAGRFVTYQHRPGRRRSQQDSCRNRVNYVLGPVLAPRSRPRTQLRGSGTVPQICRWRPSSRAAEDRNLGYVDATVGLMSGSGRPPDGRGSQRRPSARPVRGGGVAAVLRGGRGSQPQLGPLVVELDRWCRPSSAAAEDRNVIGINAANTDESQWRPSFGGPRIATPCGAR